MFQTFSRRLFALLAVFLLTTTGGGIYADNYLFKHIGSNEGLTSNYVKCIVRDGYGFMWFGTKNGLNRFDGVHMRRVNCRDEALGKENNNIGALYEDGHRHLWVGTDRGIYLYEPLKDKFLYQGAKDPRNGESADNWVQTIAGDNAGNVWALLPDQGVFRYVEGGGVSYYPVVTSGTFKEQNPISLAVDAKGDVWVGTKGTGLYHYHKGRDRFERVSPLGGESLEGVAIACLETDGRDGLLLASYSGRLYRYRPSANTLSVIHHSKEGNIYLRSLKTYDDEVWLGAQEGIYVLNLKTGAETLLCEQPLNKQSLSNNAIYTLYRSPSGDAWVGTLFGGVNYMAKGKFRFNPVGTDDPLFARRIRGMVCADDGRIWFGTEDNGFGIFDPRTGRTERIAGPGRITLNIGRADGGVALSANQRGVDFYSAANARPVHLDIPETDNCVYSYLKDSRGNEWFGLGSALYQRKPGGALVRLTQTGYDWIYAIFEAGDGVVWLGTMGNGVWKYNPRNGSFRRYEYAEKSANGLRSNSVTAIMEDRRGRIWLSTDRGGISRYDKATDSFVSYGMAEGLPDDVAYDILEDRHGFLWFGTNNGLVKFNPDNGHVFVFTAGDGLPGNQFNYHSAVVGKDGLFYFGGIYGITAFDPALMEKRPAPTSLYFTELRLSGKPSLAGTEDSPLDRNILFSDELSLAYDQATFSLDVASPGYDISGDYRYAYRLLPVDKEWQPMSGNRISFSNLTPGEYTLEVTVSNESGTATRTLRLVVRPPWWRSGWMMAVYLLMVIAAFIAWFVWYRNYKNARFAKSRELYAANKEKELYQGKVKFFTEIAHEIRTPLALIDAPLEAVEELGLKDQRLNHYIKVVRQNTRRLLSLAGDLLDFQKLDSNRLTIKYETVDINALVCETADRFEPTIQLHQKTLKRTLPLGPLLASTDREAVTKVISNLLNNALKYARRDIQLSLEEQDEMFVIRVISDGEKISPAERDRIFERFYRLDSRKNGEEGVGIGLSLARSLVELLDGNLLLEDTPDLLNSFKLVLPLNRQRLEEPETPALDTTDYLMEEESNLSKEKENAYTVLLVEDNVSMRDFIAEQLRGSFTVETACDGREAIERLKMTHVDIIVTDIMMPEMDGYELCRTVKSDMDISHVPLIFITAKNDLESKIKGLQCGAEGYVEKPFSIKYVRRLILSLLDNRRRERESFSKKPFFSVDNMKANKVDEEFMNRVVSLIEEHLCEEGFNVETMAEKLFMSRSSLLRKIKTLFNLQPVELIRTVKLKKAAELIQQGRYRIGEIGYMVGISSPSYFSKLFLKQFGVSPKEFEKQCKEQASPEVPDLSPKHPNEHQ